MRSSPCTLIVEGRDGDGVQVPGLGEEWKFGCPKSPLWESEGEAWSEDDGASSSASREGNVCNDALRTSSGCMGLATRSLFSCRIGSWQRHKAVTWPWTCCARNCMRPGRCCGCQMSLVLKKGRKRMTCPSELSWLVCFLQFCFSVNMVAAFSHLVLSCHVIVHSRRAEGGS